MQNDPELFTEAREMKDLATGPPFLEGFLGCHSIIQAKRLPKESQVGFASWDWLWRGVGILLCLVEQLPEQLRQA